MSASRRSLPSARRIPLWQAYLAIGSLGCLLYALVPPFAGSGPLINALGLSGVVAVVVGARRYRPAALGPWRCFAVGLFLFWLGDVYTYSYPRLFHVDVPFPSPGDALYVAVYPVLMFGLLWLVRRRNPTTDRAAAIDSLIMTLGLSLVSWLVLIAPYVHDHSMGLIPKIVSIAYPLGDILLLAAVIRLAVDTGKRRPALYLLGLSIATLLVTDFVYGVLTLDNAYTHQVILDVGWIFFYLLWGAAALHPSMAELDQDEPARESRLTPGRLALLAGASLIAPAIEISNELSRNPVDQLLMIAASVVLFGLVVARMAGLVRQREQSVARQRALTAAGAALVAATERSEIYRAALDAVPLLADHRTAAQLLAVDEEHVRVAADDGDTPTPRPGRSLSQPTASSLRAAAANTAGGAIVALSPQARRELEVPLAHVVVLFPLAVVGETRGLLLVASEQAVPPTVRSALHALATHVSLALESASLTDEVHRRTSEARFSSLVQRASDLITVLDATGTVVYQSPSVERILGHAAKDIVGTRFERLLFDGDDGRLRRLLADGSLFGGGETQVLECSLRHRDGSERQFEIFYTDLLDDPSVGGIVLNGRDISERKAFEEQLEHQAFHDPVTGLANRALFNERVRHAIAQGRRERRNLAVVFLDLDDFKTINDSLGHAAGDRVLTEVAQRLAASIRAGDTAARFGGDEFIVLLEDIEGPHEAVETAGRLLQAIGAPFALEQREIVLRASLGIAVLPAGATIPAEELIRNADAAMYAAKRDGKGEYRMFEPEMRDGVLERLELRGDLQRALTEGQFELHYQPLVRLGDQSIAGVEALVRWRHPERGVVQPDAFIPFAEETGLIVPIGRSVLRAGCREAKRMQDLLPDRPLSVSINLSVKQLHHSDIVSDVHDALKESGLDPSSLILEITETVMMIDADLAERRLTELKQLGVRLAMDDFGTGYSSLSYLSRFPVDILKMDRSFLRAGASPVASGLATAVLGLGEALKLVVVAEGIEFPDQSATLCELGCELGQGYYFARPMDANSTLKYLQDHSRQQAPPRMSPDWLSADAA